MNKTKTIISVFAIVALSIAAVSEASAAMPYGSIGQEDQLTAYHNGELYINVVFSQGNGQFMTISEFVNEIEAEIQ